METETSVAVLGNKKRKTIEERIEAACQASAKAQAAHTLWKDRVSKNPNDPIAAAEFHTKGLRLAKAQERVAELTTKGRELAIPPEVRKELSTLRASVKICEAYSAPPQSAEMLEKLIAWIVGGQVAKA